MRPKKNKVTVFIFPNIRKALNYKAIKSREFREEGKGDSVALGVMTDPLKFTVNLNYQNGKKQI